MPRFSIIVPVYNRIDEVRDLVISLEQQTNKDFELIIVEDGSTQPCEVIIKEYEDKVPLKYFYKPNEGRSIARNYGMERASGDYFIFFDSDCMIPSQYFEILSKALDDHYVDCFGGPDAAHESFSNTQKAINYAMTSFLTTGGIRGGKIQLEKFVPRTFNMGFSRKVWEKVGGFREMFSEDIDMSTRIRQAGFSIGLIRPACVYHKRRVNLIKFFRQVHVFGMSRITLKLLYPDSLKPVHTLPAVAVIIGCILVSLAVFVSRWWLLPIGIYILGLFIDALRSSRCIKVALLAIPAGVIQIVGYGIGFIRSFTWKILMGHGRDLNQEIAMRKGK